MFDLPYIVNPPFPLPIPLNLLSPFEQAIAAAELRDYVTQKASDEVANLGFSWTCSDATEPDCKELMHLVAVSKTTKTPLPISNARAEKTLLLDPEAEMSLRFWRTITRFRQEHCRCDVGMEIECDLALVTQATVDDIDPTAQIYLYAMLTGSTLLRSLGYGTPLDPQLYTLDVLMFGLPEAVAAEIERRREAADTGLEPAA
jgi:hypothetical protein